MSILLLSTLVTFLFSCALVVADTDNHGVTFLYPTPSLTINYKDTVNVSYTSNFSSPQLFTFCNPTGSNSVITELVQTTIAPYNGSSLVALDWTNISTCWFDLRPNATAGHGANSPSFTVNATARSPAASTFSLPSATTTSTSKHHGGAPARTGIIIAITITSTILFLFLVLGLFFWHKRRQAKPKGYATTNLLSPQYIDQVDQKWHPGGGGAAGEYVYVRPMQSYGDFGEEVSVKSKRRPTELPADQTAVELSGYPSSATRSERFEMESGNQSESGRRTEQSWSPNENERMVESGNENGNGTRAEQLGNEIERRVEPPRNENESEGRVEQPGLNNRFSWEPSRRLPG